MQASSSRARFAASRVAGTIPSRSISFEDANPTAQASAFSIMTFDQPSRAAGVICLESLTPASVSSS